MPHGAENLPGRTRMPGAEVTGSVDGAAREGLVSFHVQGIAAMHVAEALNARGNRSQLRRADHCSGNVPEPLGPGACIRLRRYHSVPGLARF